MNPSLPPPEIAPLDEARLVARRAHLEREIARSAARAPRLRIVRGTIVVAAGVAVAAVLLTGRGGGQDALAKARAAVSRGPYLGIVEHTNGGFSSTLIHLDTRSTERVRAEAETWFDTRKHGRAASVGGCVRFVGPTTRSGCVGPVFMGFSDPTWITGSIDRYRTALANGQVHKTTVATVRGRRAWWLRITPSEPQSRLTKEWVSYVAVDQKTGNPLRFETRERGRVVGESDIDVLSETHRLPSYVLTLAKLLRPLPLPAGKRHGRGGVTVTLAQGARAVPGAVWPGRTAAGQPFRRARVITLDNGKKQLELLYGDACPASCVLVKQGTESGWSPASRFYTALPDRSILVNGGRYADGRVGNIKIRLEGTSKDAVLATARALRPLVA